MNSPPLDRIRIGKSDIEVRALGVGTWAWGDRIVWGFGHGYGEPEVEAAFHASRRAGLDFFDSAEVYGWGISERILGRLAGNPDNGTAPSRMPPPGCEARRSAIPSGTLPPGSEAPQRAIIATKFFPYPWRFFRGSLVRALRASLRRLRLEQVDLYQVHWPFPPIPIETWMAGMADAVELGLARAVGVSNYSVRQMEAAHAALARRGISLASNQVEFSLLERSPERSGLLEACRDMGVTLIAYSPLAMGLLTGKYGPGRPLPLQRRRRSGGLADRVEPLIRTLREIGVEQGEKTPAQVALNWTICKGTLPIPGAKNARQAAENAGALGWRLTAGQVARLDEVSARIIQASREP